MKRPAVTYCFRDTCVPQSILTSVLYYDGSFSSETYFLGMFLPKQFSLEVKSTRLTSSFFNFQDRSAVFLIP